MKSHLNNNIKTTAIVGLATAMLNSGCSILPSHIHNDANEKTALAAQKALTEYSAQAPAMYSAMTANVDKFKTEEEYLLAELGKNTQSALGTALPSMKWKDFKARAENGQKAVTTFREKIIVDEGTRFRKEVGLAKVNQKTAEAHIAQAKKEIAAAKKNITAWNAQIAVLQQGFKDLPAGGKPLDAKAGLDVLKGIGSKKVTFVDADGKSNTEEVQKILQPQAQQIETLFTGKKDKAASGTTRPSLFARAPGIALLILNHALELAKLELQKAETELSQAQERAVLFEDALAEMKLAGLLYAEAIDFEFAGGDTPFDYVIKDWADAQKTMAKLTTDLDDYEKKKEKAEANSKDAPNPVFADAATLRNEENSTAKAALIVRKLAIAESIRNRNESTFKVKVARLEHLHSIANSALADATRRSLIRAQIDGLTAYHQGGFTKEDAANIIRIAQTVALFGIAHNTQ